MRPPKQKKPGNPQGPGLEIKVTKLYSVGSLNAISLVFFNSKNTRSAYGFSQEPKHSVGTLA
jgi:hypothetical protein